MQDKELPQYLKDKIDAAIDSLYFDFQGVPTASASMTQEYVVKLLTRFIMGACTAFWSITELVEYIHTRHEFRKYRDP